MDEVGAPGESVDQALHRGASYLERRGIHEAARNARFLLAHALGCEPGALITRLPEPLPAPAGRAYGKLLCRRGGREPLQYILGLWEFFGLELEVTQAALIPRPETELLVERTLAHLAPGPRRVVDLGAGTGAIAIALAHARPALRVIATERSPEALALARRNIARHQLEARVELLPGDWLEPLAGHVPPGTIDAIVSNPPYVTTAEYQALAPEVREHEPRLALVPGPSGLEAYERIAPAATAWLVPGGLLAFEVGCGQEEAVSAIVARAGFTAVRTWNDLAGIPRVVTALRPA